MQNLSFIEENLFVGMNDRYPSHLLPKGVFSSIENALVDNNRIVKRKGNTPVAATLGAFDILGGFAFEPAGGNKLIVVNFNGSANSQLHTWSGSGAFSAIGLANLTKDLQMNFVQASNYLFGFNGAEVVDVASDGTTVTRNRSGIPLGEFGVWFHDYLFVAGVAGNTSRLYWSNLGTPLTFTASDYVDINANDGDEITGLGVLNDELIVFKKYSVWAISGWSGATFAVTTRTGQNTASRALGVGAISHQSIVSVGRDLYYLSFNGGIPHFRSLNQTVFAKTVEEGIVSEELETTMDGLNKSQLHKCAGTYDGKFIYWAIPSGASTTNNLVLVLDPERTYRTNMGSMHSWVKYTGITPSQFLVSTISGRAKVYFGDATTAGLVYEQGTSVYTDNGTNVTMTINTRDYMMDAARKSKWKYVYHKYASGSAGTLLINARIDQAADFTLQESLSLVGNSPGLGPTGTFTIGVSVLGGANVSKNRVTFAHLTGTLLGIQFKESTSNSCELYDYQIYGFKRALRDD